GGGLTASTVHADVKPAAGEATTNDAIEQAKDKVAHATTAQQSAQAANNQAQAEVATDRQAVTQAKTDLNQAQAKQTTIQKAVDKHSQVETELKKAEESQAAIAQGNAQGQLDNAVANAQANVAQAQSAVSNAQVASSQAQSNLANAQQALKSADSAGHETTQADVDAAQSAVNTAEQNKNTADQQVNADSAAVQTADSNVNAAQTAVNKANIDYTVALNDANKQKQMLAQAQAALKNAQAQSSSTTTAKKNVVDILWIPSNFGTLMKGAFDEGAHLSQEQVDMLNELYTKNVNAFTNHMDDVMSDADYDTTYDLSGQSYNVTDKQGHGTNAQAELEVFAADVLNAFGAKLGLNPVKVNIDVDLNTNYYYKDHSHSLPSNSRLIDQSVVGASNITLLRGISLAYPIMGEPDTYSMDQLKYDIFLQLMQAMFKDDSSIQTQGDHAATLLGNRLNDRSGAANYITIATDPTSSSNLATAHSYIGITALNDQAANQIKSADYTSKLDSTISSQIDLSALQRTVGNAQSALAQAQKGVKNAAVTKQTTVQALTNAKQVLAAAQSKLDHSKQAQADAQNKLKQTTQHLADVQAAFNHNKQTAQSNAARVAQLQQAVKDAQTKVDQAQATLDNANSNLKDAKNKLQAALSALNNWKNAKQAADQKVNDLQAALDNVSQADLDAANQAVKDAQTKLDNIQQKLNDAEIKQADTAKALVATNQALAKAQQELTIQQATHGNRDTNQIVLPVAQNKDTGNDSKKDNDPIVNESTVTQQPLETKAGLASPATITVKRTAVESSASNSSFVTREEYKTAQLKQQKASNNSAITLPQTGNYTNKDLSIIGLGLATFVSLFGLTRKRRY
ncbi:LPXTG cell wall anchor domain-containing protein, partial [Limosilactobacillus rudii]